MLVNGLYEVTGYVRNDFFVINIKLNKILI